MPTWETCRLCQMTHYLQTLCRDQGDITTRTFYENKCLHGPGTRGSIRVVYSVCRTGFKRSFQLYW